MKNRLLPLFAVLGSVSVYSQVGVGTLNPNKSAQLEVVSNDKGMLIPRVKLTSTTDASTITSGNINSLLVFATDAIGDIEPGYYYWFIDRWKKIATSDEIADSGTTVSGDGPPGPRGEVGYPGKNVLIYRDTKTNIVYVQNQDGTWTQITGPKGDKGDAGVVGVEGMPGKNGVPGIPGKDGGPGENTTIVVNDSGTWVYAPGKDGADGTWTSIDGKSAFEIWKELPGNDGKSITEFLDGLKGAKGDKGEIGIQGMAGAAGVPGI